MAFDDFLNVFLGALAEPSFSNGGSLDQYLETDEHLRSGDEANVVDFRVTRCLLHALGYAQNEITYNEQKQHLRADFVVRIPDYPIRACFVVEDKSTSTKDLATHRPQLQGYMNQNRAPRGLLINGGLILAYDHQESVQTPSIEVPLFQAVAAWRGATLFGSRKEALDKLDLLPQLTALWRRHRRESFAGLQNLIDELTLQRNGEPHAKDGLTWKPEFARVSIVPVTDHVEALTAALQDIIKELEDDAGAQLAAYEKEFAEFQASARQIPGDLGTLNQQEEFLSAEVLNLCSGQSADFKDRLETLTRQVVNGVVAPGEVSKIQKSLYELHGPKSLLKNSTRSRFYLP